MDRLLTSTPASDDAAWVTKTAPDPTEASAEAAALGKTPHYLTSRARVVPAEVWAKILPAVASDTLRTATAPEVQQAPEAPKAGTPLAKGNGKPAKGAKIAKVITETPAPAPPPPAAVPAYPSLIGAIDKELGESYAKIMGKKKQIAALKEQVATEELALDQKGIADADKKAHKATLKDLEKQTEQLDDEVSSMAKTFVSTVKGSAQRAAAPARDRFGPALVNLRQAVEDASISNGAAAVRYPLAAPTLVDSTKAMAREFAADIIEEKTGKRPNLSTLQPGVTLEGGKVGLTLNGLSASDMAKISVGDLTTETIGRTQKWVTHALGLLGSIASNKEILGFEGDVLDAAVAGFIAGGWTPTAPPIFVIEQAPGSKR